MADRSAEVFFQWHSLRPAKVFGGATKERESCATQVFLVDRPAGLRKAESCSLGLFVSPLVVRDLRGFDLRLWMAGRDGRFNCRETHRCAFRHRRNGSGCKRTTSGPQNERA